MKKLKFSIQIDAPRPRVWQTLWDDTTYRRWTSVWSDSCYAESDWLEGSKILFLSGNGSGMTSKIARLIPDEFMSFQHLGEVKNGVEDFEKDWAGGHENYTLLEKNGGTELNVELDIVDDFEQLFSDTFPKALEIVKKLAEA